MTFSALSIYLFIYLFPFSALTEQVFIAPPPPVLPVLPYPPEVPAEVYGPRKCSFCV